MYTVYLLQVDDAASGLHQEVECDFIEDVFLHLEHLIKSELANPDCPRPLEFRVQLKTVTKRPVLTREAVFGPFKQVINPYAN